MRNIEGEKNVFQPAKLYFYYYVTEIFIQICLCIYCSWYTLLYVSRENTRKWLQLQI